MLLTLLTAVPPPFADHPVQLRNLVQCVLPALLLLTFMQIPLPDNHLLPIMQRLDPTFDRFVYRGRNLFEAIENQRNLFGVTSGELPETLLEITRLISGDWA